MKIILIAGARPNFMKIAPLTQEMEKHPDIEFLLIHTGQHYDEKMSDLFFRQLGLPKPDINLEIGSASHAVQTADIMKAFEPIVIEEQPDAVLVVGDVNSTIACGLVSVKLGIPLIHVEAGLRSGDRSMPEEINRILTDSISDLLFCTEQSGVDNLVREGVAENKAFMVGNVMIDTLLKNRPRFADSKILDELHLEPQAFAVLTLHRPSNVDDRDVFSGLLGALGEIQKDLPIVFPVHPRTRSRLGEFGFQEKIGQMPNLRMIDPVGYLDFQQLLSSARIVLTDSGGIQEETTALGVPCLTLRANTERPVTVSHGTNKIVGMDPNTIVSAYRETISGQIAAQVPPLWDGHAAERIVKIIRERLA
ncbi:MAG: UDP-N-acetylglucosamine 2-epimerase (non-hydrolyzing) [Gammaproteobacteria bacterium]|nr:MAG: UDP-N-acetylglucosamine 2-epimerase (non-hydrolyzing) [Gammaproteobacteria bacterium]